MLDMLPPEMWMTAEEVVSLSLASVKDRDIIFIPGEHNAIQAKKLRKKSVKKYLDARILWQNLILSLRDSILYDKLVFLTTIYNLIT